MKKQQLILIILIFILTSCTQGFKSAENSGSIILRFNLQGPSRATTVPDVSASVDHYKVTFSRSGYSDVVNDNITEDIHSISGLAEGDWNCLVQAYDSSSNLIAQSASETISVSSSNPVEKSITLDFLQNANGTLAVSIAYPLSAVIDEVNLSINGGAPQAMSLGSGNATLDLGTQASGDQRLVITLLSSSVIQAVLMETAQVYDYQSTAVSLSISEADIAQAPLGVSSFQCYLDGSSLNLFWNPRQVKTETGFELQRNRVGDGVDNWTSFDPDTISLSAGLSFYQDITAVQGESYRYRIRSVNSFGNSSWQEPLYPDSGTSILKDQILSKISLSLDNNPIDAASSQTSLLTISGLDGDGNNFDLSACTVSVNSQTASVSAGTVTSGDDPTCTLTAVSLGESIISVSVDDTSDAYPALSQEIDISVLDSFTSSNDIYDIWSENTTGFNAPGLMTDANDPFTNLVLTADAANAYEGDYYATLTGNDTMTIGPINFTAITGHPVTDPIDLSQWTLKFYMKAVSGGDTIGINLHIRDDITTNNTPDGWDYYWLVPSEYKDSGWHEVSIALETLADHLELSNFDHLQFQVSNGTLYLDNFYLINIARLPKPDFTLTYADGGSPDSAGRVPQGSTLTMSCSDPLADIYYSRDGSDPVPGGEKSLLYSGEEIELNSSSRIIARSFKGQEIPSAFTNKVYQMQSNYAYAARKTIEPVIDGIREDIWDTATEIETRYPETGASKAWARVWLIWDEDFLYAFAEIYDDTPMLGTKNNSNDDSLEFFIDQRQLWRDGNEDLTTDITANTAFPPWDNWRDMYRDEYGIGNDWHAPADKSGIRQIRVEHDGDWSGRVEEDWDVSTYTAGAENAVRASAEGYHVEAKLPWTDNFQPDSDVDNYLSGATDYAPRIGFELQVNDNEDGGSNRTGITTWTATGNGGWNDITLFGTLIFQKANPR